MLAAAGGAAVLAALGRAGTAGAADSDVPGAVIFAPDTSGRNQITPTSDVVPLSIRASASQSRDLSQWQDKDGSALASIRYDGALVSRSSLRIWGKTVGGASVAQPLILFGNNDGTGDKMRWSMGLDVASAPQNDDFFIGRVNDDESVTDQIYLKKYPEAIAVGIGFVPPPAGTSLSVSSPDAATSWTAMWLRQGSANTGSLLKGTTSAPITLFEFDRYGRLSIVKGNPEAALDVQKDAVVSSLIAKFRDSAGAHRVGISGLGTFDLSAASGRIVVNGAPAVGDKIGLYSDQYGFGVQPGRLVAYVGPGAAFAVRRASGNSTGSSYGATDTGVTLFESGSVGVGTGTQFGGGVGVIGIQNAKSVPTANPTAGGVIYVDGGALKFRGSSGTVTVLAPA